MTSALTSDECNIILDKIAAKLHEGAPKPRTVLNTLSLIEFLLKNGSPRFKIEIEEDQFFIKKLRNYHTEDDDEDLTKSIQALAQRIIALLENPDELKEAKEEAKKLRGRIHGFSSELEAEAANQSADPKYQGFSSDSYQNEKFESRHGLAKRIGVEEDDKREEEVKRDTKKEAYEKPKVEVSEPVDLLDFGGPAKPQSKVDDFLGDSQTTNAQTSQTKAKFGSKLLPPPPSKGGVRQAPNLTQSSSTPPANESSSPLDLDFDIIGGSQTPNQKTQTAVHFDTILTGEPRKMEIGSTNGKDLLGFDIDFAVPPKTQTAPVQYSQPHTNAKADFEFDFSAPVSKSSAQQKLNQQTTAGKSDDFDIFAFDSSSKHTPQQQIQQETQESKKAFGKLPAPPKKGNATPGSSQPQTHKPATTNDSDFLF